MDDDDGYIIFRDAIDTSLAYKSIYGKNVNYDMMTKFIDDNMLQFINGKLNWNCKYMKFRVSDNNNSADASVFHGDIIIQTNDTKPIFTCLTYLDETIMEVIPGSHKNISTFPFINKKKDIHYIPVM